MRTCPICNKGKFIEVQDIIFEIEGYIFVIKGHRCDTCNEEFPLEEETRKVIDISKKLGIWPEPLKLFRHLSRSSGGLVFRIPADLEKQKNLDEKK